MSKRTHIVHVVYRFAVGGLENVIVQLINRLPREHYDHTLISLTSISDFKNRLQRQDVRLIALDKPPGHAIPLYPKIYRLLREFRPDVLHTCNLAALEIAPLGWLARVPKRIHVEHGWDVHDPQGTNPRYRKLRRCYKPFVTQYVAVSQDLDRYLAEAIGVPPERHSLITNGVDTDLFQPRPSRGVRAPDFPFHGEEVWVMGTVGRLYPIKNQALLVRAFSHLIQTHPEAAQHLRLVLIGDGPDREALQALLQGSGVADVVWMAGERADIPAMLQSLDCFVLPSLSEGTSCTLQEAMACGLPIVATAVGGTPEVIDSGVTGTLVPSEDVAAMAEALWIYFSQPDRARAHGQAARATAEERYALNQTIAAYDALFSAS